LLIFGIFLRGQAAEVGADLPAKPDLFQVELAAQHERTLLIGQARFFCSLSPIAGLHPPWEKVAHGPGFAGLLPLIIETAADAVGCGLQDQLGARGQRGFKTSEDVGRIAGPAGQLRAMEVLHGESAAGVAVAGGDDTVLRIDGGKHNLSDVGARGLQRAFAELVGEPVEEAMHDAEDLFGRFLGVRDL